jgi:hypothetical protein
VTVAAGKGQQHEECSRLERGGFFHRSTHNISHDDLLKQGH